MTSLLEKGLACSAQLVSATSMHLHQNPPSLTTETGLPTALLQQDGHLGSLGFLAVLHCVKVSI